MSKPAIDVAAGLVFFDGKLLITQRPSTGHLADFWEFPGGKREAGESFEVCLRRELREELGIEVEAESLLAEVLHTYPEKSVRLQFFKCRWTGGTPVALGCQAFQWISREGLHAYRFPDADLQILEKLTGSPEWWG